MPLIAVSTARLHGSLCRFALRIGSSASCFVAIAIVMVSFLAFVIPTSAQLTVRFVPFAGNAQIDGRGIFPKLRAQLTVTHGTTPVVVTKDKVFIVENNLMVLPDNVTALPGNVALVEWTSTNKHDGTPTFLFVVDDGETGMIAGAKNVFDSTVVVIKDSTSRQLYGKIDFGRVPAGQIESFGLKIAASRSLKNAAGDELPTRLDSVRTRSSRFTTQWIGTIIDKTPPPVEMIPAFDYRLNLIFQPDDNNPVADVLTAYYENGFREDILLLANPAPYVRIPILEIKSPNGGESFAPCQKVLVSWKGMERGFAAFLEFTDDNGRSWSPIDSTMDSSYVWTVPSTPSDSVRIRVSQKLQSNFDRFAVGERAPTTTVAFSADGTRFAVGYANRKIVEFSATTAQRIGSYDAGNVGPNGSVTAITYVPNSTDLLAVVTTPTGSAGELQRFTTGTSTPVSRKALPANTTAAYLGTDSSGATAYIVPQFKAQILTYSAATLDSTAPIVLNAPATAARILNNTVTVVQLDGSVVSYSGSTKQETERTITNFAVDRYPVIRNLDVASNGLAALGGQAPVSSPFRAQNQFTYVLDRTTSIPRQVIHRAGVPTQVACAFSQTARYLGLGFMGQEQFELHDIESGTQLTSLIGTSGHVGFLSDLDFSPNGNAIVSTSTDSSNNVLLKRFNTPEEDVSDGVFRIIASQLSNPSIALSSRVIGNTLDTNITGRICNTGSVPVVISGGSFQNRSVFTLPSGLPTDTLMSGECLDVRVLAIVNDTGRITDTLIISSCDTTFRVPFEMQGIDYSLAIVGDLTDFGDVCVGDRLVKRFVMLRNTGTDSVRVNNTQVTAPAQFKPLNSIIDTIIPPGGSLEIELEFAPTRLGFDTAELVIRYANQGVVRRLWRVTGRGAGAEVRVSHVALPFIAGVPQRDVTIYNSADNAVSLISGVITAGAPFTLVTVLPLTVAGHDSVTLSVRYDGGTVTAPAELALQFVPCAASTNISLSVYGGSVDLSAPVVSADPRENTSIPIMAVIREDVPYNGIRLIEGAFTVDPQLFLAQEIETSIGERSNSGNAKGEAKILSQEIVGGLRLVRFTIEGSFGDTNEICRLIGPAGLGLADSSFLVLDSTSRWFGPNVAHTFTTGLLQIVNPNPGRKIIDQPNLVIASVQPNPASDDVSIRLTSSQLSNATLSIVDARSTVVVEGLRVDVGPTASEHTLNVSRLAPGVYTIVLATADAATVASFIVVR